MGTPYFNSVVARTGFEPVISALRGRRLKPAGLTRHLGVPICLVPALPWTGRGRRLKSTRLTRQNFLLENFDLEAGKWLGDLKIQQEILSIRYLAHSCSISNFANSDKIWLGEEDSNLRQ